MSDATNDAAVHRMKTMTRTNDGFEISSEDLKLRGPGDFFGSRQHGLPNLMIADLDTDMRAFAVAQTEARLIFDADPSLSLPEHRALKAEIAQMFSETVFN